MGKGGEQVEISAAAQLPVVPPPKVKANQQSIPSYLKTAKPDTGTTLPITDRSLASKDITTYRGGLNTRQVIKDFIASSPDLSAAVFAYLRLAITKDYTAVAKNLDGSFNPEGTMLAQQMLMRFDVLNDYSQGFSGMNSMRSNSESLGKELISCGACSAELVLDKTRLPARIQPISVTNIEFYPDKVGFKPVQKLGGAEINLDIPTFFYIALDQDLLEPYASSMLEPAIQPVLFSQEFMNDVRRIIKKALHPRVKVTLVMDKLIALAPPEAQSDQSVMNTFIETQMNNLQTYLETLEPDDALVLRDAVEAEYLNNGSTSLSAEYDTVGNMANSKLATGAKTMPTILGHGTGSQNIASTETMMFCISVAGAVQYKLNELYSRMLTLAVRLFGLDVVVEFRYGDINLRPELELESFRSMKQARWLELLSLGLVTDEQASLELTGHLPMPGAPVLSGTNFQVAAPATSGNPNNGTTPTNSGSALNQNLNPSTPQGAKSKNKSG